MFKTLRKRTNSSLNRESLTVRRSRASSAANLLRKTRSNKTLLEFKHVGKRVLLLNPESCQVSASLTFPPKSKMVNLAKTLLNSEVDEPPMLHQRCFVKHSVISQCKPKSSTSTMFRDYFRSSVVTINDGKLVVHYCPKGRKKSSVFGSRTSRAYSKVTDEGRRRASSIDDTFEFYLSHLVSVKSHPTKSNVFTLYFYSADSNSGSKNSCWTKLPDVEQLVIKIEKDREEKCEEFAKLLLAQVYYLTLYNQQLLDQLESDIREKKLVPDTEEGDIALSQKEILLRLEIDLKTIVHGFNSHLLFPLYANFSQFLKETGDRFEEASFWNTKAARGNVSKLSFSDPSPPEHCFLSKVRTEFNKNKTFTFV